MPNEEDVADEEVLPPLIGPELKKKLNDARPDETTEDSWTQSIADEVAKRMPLFEAKQRAARQIVVRAEADLLKSMNNHLRAWVKTGQWPITWMDLKSFPLALNGKGHKVRLGACSMEQLTLAMQYQSANFAEQHKAFDELMLAFRTLIAGMRERRYPNLDAADWPDSDESEDEDAA